MDLSIWMGASQMDADASLLAAINGKLSAGGCIISAIDARALAEQRNQLLGETERLEFGEPAILAIAETVATSPYLSASSPAADLSRLQAVFYFLRDELPSDVPDAEIVDALRGCLGAWGDVDTVASLEPEAIMRCSADYRRALESGDAVCLIVDDEGRTYAFDERTWDYDEQADGWSGERWADDLDD